MVSSGADTPSPTSESELKVLLVTGSFPPLVCGVGDYCGRLSTALACQSGIELSVLTSRAAGHQRIGGVKVLAEIDTWHLREARQVLATIRREAPDIVHVQYPTQNYVGRLPNAIPMLAKLAGTAVVQTWHEPLRLRDLVQKKLAASTVIVVRENFADLLTRESRFVLGGTVLHYIPGAAALPVAALDLATRNALRDRYLRGQQRLVVFFGFIYPHKGVEQVFDIADPASDHIVVAGKFACDDEYRARLLKLADGKWKGKVTFTGFLEASDAAELLAVADAVLLPFRDGGGAWNSSLSGAILNGAYVVTTSKHKRGYDAAQNVAYSDADDIDGMRSALALSEERRACLGMGNADDWEQVAARHVDVYREALARSKTLKRE